MRLAAIAVALLLAAPAASQATMTVFVAKRPGLAIKLTVSGHRIVGASLASWVDCEESGRRWGSASIFESTRIGIHPDGRFRKSEFEGYEGSGIYEWKLTGRVRPNRIVGNYYSHESLVGEEGPGDDCVTKSPRGHFLRFIAHRAAGPPWRG